MTCDSHISIGWWGSREWGGLDTLGRRMLLFTGRQQHPIGSISAHLAGKALAVLLFWIGFFKAIFTGNSPAREREREGFLVSCLSDRQASHSPCNTDNVVWSKAQHTHCPLRKIRFPKLRVPSS